MTTNTVRDADLIEPIRVTVRDINQVASSLQFAADHLRDGVLRILDQRLASREPYTVDDVLADLRVLLDQASALTKIHDPKIRIQ